MAEFMFKIKDITTGKYSAGGSNPKWSKNGKVWNSLHALNLHLNMIADNKNMHNVYENAIVEYYEFKKINSVSAQNFVNMVIKKRECREKEKEKEREDYLNRQRWEQYQKLKEEFEK